MKNESLWKRFNATRLSLLKFFETEKNPKDVTDGEILTEIILNCGCVNLTKIANVLENKLPNTKKANSKKGITALQRVENIRDIVENDSMVLEIVVSYMQQNFSEKTTRQIVKSIEEYAMNMMAANE